MALQRIEIPDSIQQTPVSEAASQLIDEAHERIEEMMLLSGSRISDNFVTSDFSLVDQALDWIENNHLLTGNRFCELGSGMGVAAMLASMRGMEAVGIETDPLLVSQATALADAWGLSTRFFCGSFIPASARAMFETATDLEHIHTADADAYEEMGLELDDFDLCYAFPWPGEQSYFEAIFRDGAASGGLLLTYGGRDGMQLKRRV